MMTPSKYKRQYYMPPVKCMKWAEKEYVDKLRQDGMRNFIKYGIACFKKDCKVVIGE